MTSVLVFMLLAFMIGMTKNAGLSFSIFTMGSSCIGPFNSKIPTPAPGHDALSK